MERIGDEVGRELARFGPQGAIGTVVEAWPAVVGEAIAANAWPARIGRDGTLHVNTSSSAWAFELGQLAPTILEQLRGALDAAAPRAVRFSVGHLPAPGGSEEGDRSHRTVEPSPEALRRAAELTAEVGDSELRERMRRAAAASLGEASSDHPFC